MPLTQEEIEERLLALEERNEKLERLLRSGKAFTNNPLALATDLDDIGSIKTHLDFEEAPLTPVDPPPDVGRVWGVARVGLTNTSLRYVDTSGVVSEVTHPPKCEIAHNTTQVIANDTVTPVAFNAGVRDTDSMHDDATNNTRITAKTAGWYLFAGVMTWPTNATGDRAAWLRRGGTDYYAGQWENASTAGGRHMQTVSFMIQMAVDEYVELVAYQKSGDGLTLLASNAGNIDPLEFTAAWIAP